MMITSLSFSFLTFFCKYTDIFPMPQVFCSI